MTATSPTFRPLVHVIRPERRPAGLADAELLPDGVSTSTIADRLATANLLVVDDALAFPFEALGAIDVPLAVRVPYELDGPGLEAVLGRDLLDHLTSLDVVAGPSAALGRALTRRRLPRSRVVGGEDLTVEQLLNRARSWRQQLDERWRPRPAPSGAPLDVVDLQVPPGRSAMRLRHAKERLAREVPALRDALDRVVERQPKTRRMQAIVAARAPEEWAPALPPAVDAWTALPLVADGDLGDDLAAAGVEVVDLPGHLRLSVGEGAFDLAVVAADVLHSPVHAVERLFEELLRSVRPGGALVLLAEVVVDPARERDRRPVPLSSREVVELVSHASGRQVLLESVRAIRRPGEDHHRCGLFRWTHLGTAWEGSTWR